VINNNNDQHQLQNDLQQLEIWEKKWQMQFNAVKCFTIHLTKKRKTAEFFRVKGSHTELAYSIDGRTKVVYAAAFTSFGQECILRLRKTMVRLARRAKARATFMYKIVNNLVDVHAEHILTPSDNRTRGNAAYRTLYKC
jgi:hypothetical protein